MLMSLGMQLTLTAANIVAGKYIYTRDLQSLDLCRPSQPPGQYLSAVNPSPLRWPAWCWVLELHPDQAFASYLAHGLREGFRIGFNYEKSCSPIYRNMISAMENLAVVREYIEEECQLGCLVPVETLTTASVQLSLFGMIPKPGQPGRWHLIVNLSSPEGASMNDGSDSQLSSLHYASVDDALNIAVKELLPVVIAAILWGPCWAGLHIRCFSDNTAVVFAINRRVGQRPSSHALASVFIFCGSALQFEDLCLAYRGC